MNKNGNKQNLREAAALSPNATVMTDDGGVSEAVTFDLTEKVVINISLPRHASDFLSKLRIFSRVFKCSENGLGFSFLGCVDSTELYAYINGCNHLEITQMPFSLPYFRCFGLADKKKKILFYYWQHFIRNEQL